MNSRCIQDEDTRPNFVLRVEADPLDRSLRRIERKLSRGDFDLTAALYDLPKLVSEQFENSESIQETWRPFDVV